MFKDLLNKGKCTLGFHAGEWSYAGDSSCEMVRVCERCGVESRRTEHRFGEWAMAEQATCTMARACERCGEQETKVEHEWGGWSYTHLYKCSQERVCARCGAANDRTRRVHEWAEYEYSDYYAGPVRVCARCGELARPGDSGDDPSDEELRLIFEAILGAEAGPPPRRILEANRQSLLSRSGGDFLERMREQTARAQPLRDRLNDLERRLELFREVGLEAALRDDSADDEPAPEVGPTLWYGPSFAEPYRAQASAGEIDPQLIGTWKNSRSEGRDPVVLYSQYYELRADGTAIRSEYTGYVGTYGGVRAGNTGIRETARGTWTARNGVLHLSDNRGNAVTCRYRLHGNTLACTLDNGFVQEWVRSS
jgi:hypothetical protein